MWSAYIIETSNPNIPERSCFNDSHYIDGKELYKRLCLPKINNNSDEDSISFDTCTRESDRCEYELMNFNTFLYAFNVIIGYTYWYKKIFISITIYISSPLQQR